MINVFQYVAAALFIFCQLANSFEMLLLARLITGFGCGAASGLVPMYLTEIAPVNIRGAMGVLHQFACTFGILLSQVMGLQGCLGRESLWPYLLAFYIVPCTIALLILPWFPESPRYLLVNCNLEAEAVKALQTFRGEEDVSVFIEEMRAEQEIQRTSPKWTFGMLFRARDLRLPLILLCSLAMSQQLSGINVVFYYSTGIFLEANIPETMVQYANIGAGAVNMLMTGVSVPLMEKSGRRPLLLGGMGLMTFSTVGLTLAITLQPYASWLSFISIICVITYVVGFAIGIGSIPQFIGAELFKQGPRPPAMSFAGLLNWVCNFLVGITFPSMQSAIEAYSFLVFASTLIGFGIFFYFKLPETKNKTFDQIYDLMGIKPPVDQEKGSGIPLLANGDEKRSAPKYASVAPAAETQPINGNANQPINGDYKEPIIDSSANDIKESTDANGQHVVKAQVDHQ
jgi:SP family facilitated glucose transporter-like MFS transporter 1